MVQKKIKNKLLQIKPKINTTLDGTHYTTIL